MSIIKKNRQRRVVGASPAQNAMARADGGYFALQSRGYGIHYCEALMLRQRMPQVLIAELLGAELPGWWWELAVRPGSTAASAPPRSCDP